MTSTFTIRTSAIIATTLIITVLAGCGGGAPGSTQSPQTPATPPSRTPVPETTTPAPSADPDELSTWTVTLRGMGPLEIDSSFETAKATLPDWAPDEQCPWVGFWSDQDAGVSAYFAREADDDDGDVETIAVQALDAVQPSDGPRTAEGIGLGSTRSDVTVAYPDATEQPATIGDSTYVKIMSDDDADVFLTFREGADVVSEITVTSEDEPPYEVCG